MDKIAQNLRDGCASPAVSNDNVFIPLLEERGVSK